MMQPGKSITQVYKISNDGDTDLVLNSVVVPFQVADEYGNVVLDNSQLENSQFLSWFYFQNADLSLGQKFVLKAGKTQGIVLKIKVPENAPEDDYYATFLLETVPAEATDQNFQAQALAKIGGNILLTVSKTGEPPKKAEIEEFSLANPILRIGRLFFIDSFDAPVFNLRLANLGRTFFKPLGTINIAGWLDQKYSLSLLEENVLSGSQRMINCQEVRPTGEANYGPCSLKKKFLLGGFRAKVSFGLDKPEDQYSKQFTFLAVPFKLFLGFLVTVFLLFIVNNRVNYHLTRDKKTSKN